MKTIMLILVACITATAQEVIVIKKDGSKLAGKVTATSASTIFLPGQSIKLSDIASVDLQEQGSLANDLTELLTKAGIPVTVLSQTTEGIVRQEIKPAVITETDAIEVKLDKFAVQRKTGKLLQVGGAILASIGALVSEDAAPVVVAVGGATAVIGLAVDIDAGRHLRLKK